jgi:hypothetical protein
VGTRWVRGGYPLNYFNTFFNTLSCLKAPGPRVFLDETISQRHPQNSQSQPMERQREGGNDEARRSDIEQLQVKKQRVEGNDEARASVTRRLRDRLSNGLFSKMLAIGPVTVQLHGGNITVEGPVCDKTSQDAEQKAHDSIIALAKIPRFMEQLCEHLVRGDEATFQLDSTGKVHTNFVEYEPASKQAPPPVFDEVFLFRGPAEQQDFTAVRDELCEILGDEHAYDAFAYNLQKKGCMSFHIENSACDVMKLFHSVGQIPDNVVLDPQICELVNTLLTSECLEAFVKKLASHLVQELYTGRNIRSTFKLEKDESGVQGITSNIKEVTGSLYLFNDRVVRGNPSQEGANLGLPGRVQIVTKDVEDFKTGMFRTDSKYNDGSYPGNVTPRAEIYINWFLTFGKPHQAREVSDILLEHLLRQLYEVGFFLC